MLFFCSLKQTRHKIVRIQCKKKLVSENSGSVSHMTERSLIDACHKFTEIHQLLPNFNLYYFEPWASKISVTEKLPVFRQVSKYAD